MRDIKNHLIGFALLLFGFSLGLITGAKHFWEDGEHTSKKEFVREKPIEVDSILNLEKTISRVRAERIARSHNGDAAVTYPWGVSEVMLSAYRSSVVYDGMSSHEIEGLPLSDALRIDINGKEYFAKALDIKYPLGQESLAYGLPRTREWYLLYQVNERGKVFDSHLRYGSPKFWTLGLHGDSR